VWGRNWEFRKCEKFVLDNPYLYIGDAVAGTPAWGWGGAETAT